MSKHLSEGLEEGVGEFMAFREAGVQQYDPNPDRIIAISQAKSLKRLADVAERMEHKLLSDTSRSFFRKIVAFVMAAPLPTGE